jgi:hypothetical protein
MNATLARCYPDDVIVVSAAGGHHPEDEVWKYWTKSGKHVVATFDPSHREPERPLMPGVAGTVADAVAQSLRNSLRRNVILSLYPDGHSTVEYTNCPIA